MAWTEEEEHKRNIEQKSDHSVSVEDDVFKAENSEETTIKQPDLNSGNDLNSNYLWPLLAQTLNENLIEKRRARRWKVFFRLAYLCSFLLIVVLLINESDNSGKNKGEDFVAVLPLEGQIGAGQPIDANVVLDLLDEAYLNTGIQALVLKMNSPGGSPVHSGIIYDAIQLKKAQYPEIPIHVVVEDLAASGGYYIAAAADQIFVDKASLLGSIGVISAGFDATELMKKIGVKRRVFTAGENKAFLDPFLPLEPSTAKKWQSVLNETHEQFIHAVKIGREGKLVDHPDLFTGAVFSGVRAIELGLADGLSSYHQLITESYGDMEVVYFVQDKEPWEQITQSFGVSIVNAVLKSYSLQ